MLIYGGEDEFVNEDMRKSCSELMVIWLALWIPSSHIVQEKLLGVLFAPFYFRNELWTILYRDLRRLLERVFNHTVNSHEQI